MNRVAVAGLLTVALALIGCGGDGSDPGAERRVANCSTSSSAPDRLTPAQMRRVGRILHTDPVMAEVIDGSSFRIKYIAAWQTAAATELQGGVATLTQVDPPRNIDHVRVPFISEPFNGRPDIDPCLRYLQRSAVLTASGVTGMEVWVDLRKAAVVQIGSTPLSGSNFNYSDESGPEPSAAYRAPKGY